MPTTVSCPTCQAKVVWQASSTHRPFCSERCRLIDLGEWASEGHKIPGQPMQTLPSGEPGLSEQELGEPGFSSDPDNYY
ncbi:DNA gyrase inhibitor YacG [Idiomarina xiamenensis]|uniref:DNA gyrase inhibitor YacG n=1 Tax=Idiomarina xiamenensis 10-D-4 TaxID=740709 RepID=K2KBW1_9GAMM|nr:DNA gyrase inhibitor YacG [Idiomarina xiamenensis]EKE85323.1 hypothetical protein A10D4_03225 [Idiomarina xiamenensis 10-D-4]